MFQRLKDYGITCLHPRRVFNKYTHEWITVSCGKCEACQKQRNNRLISMINNAASAAKVTYFLTLTYSNENLPVVEFNQDPLNQRCVSSYSVHTFDYRTHESIVSDFEEHIPLSDSDVHFFDKGMPSLSTSSYLGKGRFGCLVKSDLQKFFKRFRKLFSYAFPSDSFKYFAIGEYGSQTFRPHYHILLFVDNVLPFSKVSSLCCLSWKSGLIDFQVSKGMCASYVASYMSSSTPLPSFLRARHVQSFYVHSSFSTFSFSFEQEKKLFESAYVDCNSSVVKEISSGYTLLPYPSTARARLFPKPSRFNERDSFTLLQVLQRYSDAVERQCKEGLDPSFVTFPVKCFVYNCADDYQRYVEGCVEYDVETIDLNLSRIHDAYLCADSKYKKNDLMLVDSREYIDLYASYKVYKISKLLGISAYSVAKRIIEYYKGSAIDEGNNFALQLLNLQYSCLENCDTFEEVRFLYSFFNAPTEVCALGSASLSTRPVSRVVLDHFKGVVASEQFVTVKHKQRNSYYQYHLHHKDD